MGCGGSSAGSPKRKPRVNNHEDGYDRKPKVSVRIGAGIGKFDVSPRIIFIFGGPGSRKGCIVDDLLTAYNLTHICTEDILNQELPKKLASVARIETVSEMKEVLEGDPSQVTLDWLLGVISERIATNLNGQFLIDFIPNLKFMLKSKFLQENIAEALKTFEEKYPISFALNLAIPTDKVIGAKQVYCASPTNGDVKENTTKEEETDAAKLQSISAEFDSDMIKRRTVLYEMSSRALLDYFNSSDRLVTVDVSCGVAQLIWHQVHEILGQLDFLPSRSVNTVLLFVFNDSDLNGFDYKRYHMEEIDLQQIVENPSSSVESLLQTLTQHVDKRSKQTDSFVVKTNGTTISKNNLRKGSQRTIVFTDITEDYLEAFLPGSPKNFQPRSGSHKYKAVSSLENELCLFPLDTNDELCNAIALQMARFRTL